jgi:hypothetical protein
VAIFLNKKICGSRSVNKIVRLGHIIEQVSLPWACLQTNIRIYTLLRHGDIIGERYLQMDKEIFSLGLCLTVLHQCR